MFPSRYYGEESAYIKIKVVGVYEIDYNDVEYWHKEDIEEGMRTVY